MHGEGEGPQRPVGVHRLLWVPDRQWDTDATLLLQASSPSSAGSAKLLYERILAVAAGASAGLPDQGQAFLGPCTRQSHTAIKLLGRMTGKVLLS